MKTAIKISLCLYGILSADLSSFAFAVTKNNNLAISAEVLATCSIQNSSLPFGNYQSQLLEQAGNVSVNCSSGTTYSVALDGGATGSGPSTRSMQGPANGRLSYELYKDPSRTQTWGNSSTSDMVSSTGTGLQQNLPVYGRIPAGQNPVAGAYADTVVVTLSY